MSEPIKIKPLEETMAIVSHNDGKHSITAVQVQTDTKVINHRLYLFASEIHEATGLSKSEVKEYLASAPQDKIATIDNKIAVRLPTVMKWNQSSLQSSDPEVRDQAQAFQSSAHNLLTEPNAMNKRAISATFVPKKSTQAKENKRKELRKKGEDNICQLSQQPINGQKTQIHHKERVADKPELAAESENLVLTLEIPHQEEHKNDKMLPTSLEL